MASPGSFPELVLETIRREELFPRGGPVVAGVSGGADSMALLLVLRELGAELAIEPTAAHLDHALREDSAEDAAFVRDEAARLGVPFVGERVDWSARGGVPRSNVEAAAREVRYEFLHRVAGSRDATIAVGHHADDRLETFLARLLQGAGPGGLAGPRYRRDDGVVRPLLDRTRDEIVAWLRERGAAFRTDPTNLDGSNLRSRLRAEVVPLLTRENPRLPAAVGRTSKLLAELDGALAEIAAGIRRELVLREAPGELALDGPRGRPYHPMILSTLLRDAIGRVGPDRPRIGFDPVDRCARAWKGGEECFLDLPGGVRIAVEKDRVLVSRPALPSPPPREIPVPGGSEWGDRLRIRAEKTAPPDDPAAASGPRVAWLDLDRIEPPVRIRSRERGDRYRPVGLAGTVKVQDLFVDRKVPRERRGDVPVLEDEAGILWIPGFRVDHRARITEETKTAVRVEISGPVPSLQESHDDMNPETTTADRIGKVMLSEEEIRTRVATLGQEIAEEYGDEVPVCVNILKGGFVFLADLTRAMAIDCEVDFMVVSSYEDHTESSGVVRILSDLALNIEGRHVLIVEDIVDTGLTLDYIRELLLARNPASLRIVTLLDKHDRRQVIVPIDWVGFRIPDEFVVGYGLDYAQRYRNLPYITVLDDTDLPDVGGNHEDATP